MIDIEAIIRHASEKLKYCFENYKIRRYKFNNKIKSNIRESGVSSSNVFEHDINDTFVV